MNGSATPELAPEVYAGLRRLAARCLRRERKDHTLQATALVHEAYLELQDCGVNDRVQFFRFAAQTMRNLLISHARKRQALKRQGARNRLSLTQVPLEMESPSVDVLALHEVMEQLATVSPRKAQIVELRFFGGCTVDEVAEVLKMSRATVEREWRFTRAWLAQRLGDESAPPEFS